MTVSDVESQIETQNDDIVTESEQDLLDGFTDTAKDFTLSTNTTTLISDLDFFPFENEGKPQYQPPKVVKKPVSKKNERRKRLRGMFLMLCCALLIFLVLGFVIALASDVLKKPDTSQKMIVWSSTTSTLSPTNSQTVSHTRTSVLLTYTHTNTFTDKPSRTPSPTATTTYTSTTTLTSKPTRIPTPTPTSTYTATSSVLTTTSNTITATLTQSQTYSDTSTQTTTDSKSFEPRTKTSTISQTTTNTNSETESDTNTYTLSHTNSQTDTNTISDIPSITLTYFEPSKKTITSSATLTRPPLSTKTLTLTISPQVYTRSSTPTTTSQKRSMTATPTISTTNSLTNFKPKSRTSTSTNTPQTKKTNSLTTTITSYTSTQTATPIPKPVTTLSETPTSSGTSTHTITASTTPTPQPVAVAVTEPHVYVRFIVATDSSGVTPYAGIVIAGCPPDICPEPPRWSLDTAKTIISDANKYFNELFAKRTPAQQAKYPLPADLFRIRDKDFVTVNVPSLYNFNGSPDSAITDLLNALIDPNNPQPFSLSGIPRVSGVLNFVVAGDKYSVARTMPYQRMADPSKFAVILGPSKVGYPGQIAPIHEMGHVFGFPHTDSPQDFTTCSITPFTYNSKNIMLSGPGSGPHSFVPTGADALGDYECKILECYFTDYGDDLKKTPP